MDNCRLMVTRCNVKYLVVVVTVFLVGLLVLIKPITKRAYTSLLEVDYESQTRVAERHKLLAMQSTEQIQTDRRDRVERICSRNNIYPRITSLNPDHFKFIYVDDTYKFMYGMIPKVACTNFKRVMLILSGKMNTTDPMKISPAQAHSQQCGAYLKTLDMYTEEEIKHRLDTYFKFMFVRNPFERILSAYRNKFTVSYNKYFPKRYGRDIIKKYRKKPTVKAVNDGIDVTFDEFIKYLLDPETERPLNAHWRQYYKLCHPCIMRYDAIGEYDTLDADMDYVLQKIGVSNIIKFPVANRIKGRPRTTDILQKSYANISTEDIHKLWELYSVDFAMFGYSYPEFTVDNH